VHHHQTPGIKPLVALALDALCTLLLSPAPSNSPQDWTLQVKVGSRALSSLLARQFPLGQSGMSQVLVATSHVASVLEALGSGSPQGLSARGQLGGGLVLVPCLYSVLYGLLRYRSTQLFQLLGPFVQALLAFFRSHLRYLRGSTKGPASASSLTGENE
jgi:hypothetical protein